MRISDWSSDVCSSDLQGDRTLGLRDPSHDLSRDLGLEVEHPLDGEDTLVGLGPSDTASIGIVQLDRDPNPLPDVLKFTGKHEYDTCCLTDDDDIGFWSEPTDGLRSVAEQARLAGQFSD